MSESQAVNLVKQLYASFDEEHLADVIAGVRQLCAPDAEWQYPPVKELAYGGRWQGAGEIARFFEAHEQEEEVLDFRPDTFIAQGEYVAVLGTFRGRAKATGREWDTRFVHVITVANHTITRFAAHFDTAAAVEAHRG